MIKVSKMIERIQGKFEGGKSLKVNFMNILKEASIAMTQNIAPKRLTRFEKLYGGVINGLTVYYCPEFVKVPKGLYKKLTKLNYTYVPPEVFERQIQEFMDKLIFTITYINGAKFIYITGGEVDNSFELSDMSSTSDIDSSDMTVTLNTHDYITGSGSIMGTFTDTQVAIKGLLEQASDLSSFEFGTAMVVCELFSPLDVESIKLRIKTTDTDFYTIDATDSIGYLIEGYNFVRANISEKVPTGSPDLTNITGWELHITMKAGKSQIVIVDNITLYESSIYNVKFVSTAIFVDKTTMARKTTPENEGDMIDLDSEAGEEDIFLYEACRITAQESTNEAITSADRQSFDTELSRRYSLYFEKNPSDEMPLSYNDNDADKYLN